MSDKELILVGYSGHGFVVAEAAQASAMNIKHYAELAELDTNPFNLQYLGFEGDEQFKGWENDYEFALGIGDNKLRYKIAGFIEEKGQTLVNVIHNSASIAGKVTIGKGNFVARNASVNPLASIGNYCILNTACIVEHECLIKDAVHIAPGAVLAGNVTVGERTFVGANSVIRQGVTIGKDVIIGAGSVVLNDIPDNEVWFGNPAKRK